MKKRRGRRSEGSQWYKVKKGPDVGRECCLLTRLEDPCMSAEPGAVRGQVRSGRFCCSLTKLSRRSRLGEKYGMLGGIVR